MLTDEWASADLGPTSTAPNEGLLADSTKTLYWYDDSLELKQRIYRRLGIVIQREFQ